MCVTSLMDALLNGITKALKSTDSAVRRGNAKEGKFWERCWGSQFAKKLVYCPNLAVRTTYHPDWVWRPPTPPKKKGGEYKFSPKGDAKKKPRFKDSKPLSLPLIDQKKRAKMSGSKLATIVAGSVTYKETATKPWTKG